MIETNFDIRKADSNLMKMLDDLEKRGERFYKQLYRFCEDVDYYRERGFEEKEAIRYVKYWYTKNK